MMLKLGSSSSSSDYTTTKRLKQTDISSYFTNAVKPLIRRNSGKMRRSYVGRASASKAKVVKIVENTTLLPVPVKPDFSCVEECKLLVDIYSDEEDDAANDGTITASSTASVFATPSLPKKSKLSDSSENTRSQIELDSTVSSSQIDDTDNIADYSFDDTIINVNQRKSTNSNDLNDDLSTLADDNYDDTTIITDKTTIKPNYDNLLRFKALIKRVFHAQHLRRLLTKDDIAILLKLWQMRESFQFVCIRLFTWRRKWYNIFKFIRIIKSDLNDDEVVELYDCLKSHEFVDTNYLRFDLAQLLNSMQLKELKELCKSFKLKIRTTKSAIIAHLLQHCSRQRTLFQSSKSTNDLLRERIREKMGFCVKLTDDIYNCLYKVFILSTFTSSHFDDLNDFFRNDLNHYVYPTYDVDINYAIFCNADEFSEFFDARMLRIEFDKLLERKRYDEMLEVCKRAYKNLQKLNDTGLSIVKPRYLERYCAAAQYVSLLSTASKHLLTHYHLDVKLWLDHLVKQHYHESRRGFWYCELAFIQMKYLQDYESAAKTIIYAMENEQNTLSEVQLHELANRGSILKRSKKNKISQLCHDEIVSLSPICNENYTSVTINERGVKSTVPGKKRLYVHYDTASGTKHYMDVEEVAIKYYQNQNYTNGIHCEHGLISATFTTLFWDIIYNTYVPGVFLSNIQSVPLDMYSKHFYLNRKDLCDQRLDDIDRNWSEAQLNQFIIDIYKNHSNKMSLFQIDRLLRNSGDLIDAIACLGRGVLCQVFRRILKGYGPYSSGFPDLFVWNVQTKKCKFVEVKSDNDRLSIKQKLWLNYLAEIGVDVEVCHVHSIGTKRKLVTRNLSDEL